MSNVTFVLLQIDPATAADKLGSGDTKYVLAVIVVTLAVVASWLGKRLMDEMKGCSNQMLDLTAKKIESDNKLASALEGVEKVVEAALAAMKR